MDSLQIDQPVILPAALFPAHDQLSDISRPQVCLNPQKIGRNVHGFVLTSELQLGIASW